VNFQEYRALAIKTASEKSPTIYYAMGVAGEAGEVIDAVKKLVRDCYNGISTTDSINKRIEKIKDEIGDLMWYLAVLYGKYVHAGYVFLKGNLKGTVRISAAIERIPSISIAVTEIITNETLSYSTGRENPPASAASSAYSMLDAVLGLCNSLCIDIEDVLEQNIKKLSERYPEGFKVGVK